MPDDRSTPTMVVQEAAAAARVQDDGLPLASDGGCSAQRTLRTRLSILIPAYNERDTIREVLRRVHTMDGPEWDLEVIVVDDASTDGTADLIAADPRVALLSHAHNQGKGAAIRHAIDRSTGDIIIIQDADLEYDPEDYPALAEPIRDGRTRVVYGSRFLAGRPRMAWPNYLCNRLLALMANVLYGANITDEATCYKAFDAPLLRQLPLVCRRFEFCPEVTAKLLRRGERILEVPVRYSARGWDAGKKIRWWDGVIAMWTLLRYRFWR